MLNIPHVILNKIKDKQNILIAGIGGGFDIYGGLPLVYTLKAMGKNVHLANYSFSNISDIIMSGAPEVINQDLVGAHGNIGDDFPYYPEGYLAKWLKHIYKQDIPVWTLNKTGVKPVIFNYKLLVERFKIDFILLIDGGVDSLNTGEEEGSGTLLEDSINLAAFNEIDVEKIVVCVGFGTEVEENVCGLNVLRNIANLVKTDSFYGSCSLTKHMNSYKLYQSACTFTFNKPNHKTSHIHRRIIPAVEGEFGDYHATDEDPEDLEICISPLMSIMWFFDFNMIFVNNKVIPYVSETMTFFEAVQSAVPFIKSGKIYPRSIIPY